MITTIRFFSRVKNTFFAVQAANGHLKMTHQSSQKKMKIEILTTPSCSNCSVVERQLDELGAKYSVIDVTEKPEYLEKYPIFTAPGIVINGKLEFTGVPKKEKLAEKLRRL